MADQLAFPCGGGLTLVTGLQRMTHPCVVIKLIKFGEKTGNLIFGHKITLGVFGSEGGIEHTILVSQMAENLGIEDMLASCMGLLIK